MSRSDTHAREEAWREELHAGQYLDAMDTATTWCEAVVIKLAAKKVHIHFRGWGSKYNEWIRRDSERLAPAYSHVKNWRVLHEGDSVQVGTIMLGRTIPVWHNATVRQVRRSGKKKGGVPAQVQVELDGVGEKRWVDAQDDLLCAAATHNIAQVLDCSDGKKTTSGVKPTKPTDDPPKKRKRLTTKRGDDDTSDDEDEDADNGEAKKRFRWYESLTVGSLLEVAEDDTKKWYEARVVCERPSKISVRFRGWPWKFDEWLPRDSKRLAPLHTYLGNWRAFDSFGYVKIGFRKSANQDAASHWVLGHVVKKFKNPSTHEVERIEVKWKDDDGNEHSDVRDVEDDFLAPEGVSTFPPTEPPEDESDSDSSDGHESTSASAQKTESDDEPEDEEDAVEEEEPFEIEEGVEEEQKLEPHDGDTTASTVSDGQSDTPATERVETAAKAEKSTRFAETMARLKGKIKEDVIEMYNRTMRAHIAMIDALEWSVPSHNSVETQTEPEPEVARPAKRRTSASRGRDDDRQHVWKGLAPASKNTPAHL